MSFKIEDKKIGISHPTYFIADIAANHDGDLQRAKTLISLAKESGADAAKFQHFRAENIVSKYGFEHMGGQVSHQAKWKKSVYEVYEDASINWEWTEELHTHAMREGIHFFSSPYDLEAVDHLEGYVPAYKIGSGDITWGAMLSHIASKNKPVILATGASTADEVAQAMEYILPYNNEVALLQCNTNYTGSIENLKYVSLNVLNTYKAMFPDMVLGLSDHTPGCLTVLAAVALGARIIEKHFTDDNNRTGPDHPFSMNPIAWREMVDRTREVEAALGNSVKIVEDNEKETVVLQRRCVRVVRDMGKGEVLLAKNLNVLRPATLGACQPNEIPQLIGKKLRKNLPAGHHISWSDVE